MKKKKLVITVIIILVAVVITGFIATKIFRSVVEDITEQEIARIRQGEVDRITQQEIELITGEKSRDITNQIMGSDTADYQCTLTRKAREFVSPQYYTGPLIDSHVHMPVASSIVSTVAIQSGFEDMPAFDKELSIDYLVCLFDSEGIQNTFGFFMAPMPVFDSSVSMFSDIKEKHPNKIVTFYMPTPLLSIDPDSNTIIDMLEEHSGLYQGLGEIKFAYSNIENDKPEDKKYLDLYQIADDYQLIIMMHPREDQTDALKRLLEKYPNVPFLLHGVKEIREEVGRLMDSYNNLYYSVDAELTSIYGWGVEHQSRGPSKEEYLSYLRANFETTLKKSLQEWKALIEAHPDRFVWGTDRWYRWHFDYEVGGLLEEMGRLFIGQLDPAVQEKFAYKNAERLLQN